MYIGHQVELAICSCYALFCVAVGSFGGVTSVQLVSNSFNLPLATRCLLLIQYPIV